MERMKRALLIAAVCAPLLAACASAGPRKPETALPAAFEAPVRGASLPAAALDRWWTLYDDPQLTALVEEGLGRGFDVRQAAARLEQSRAIRQGQSAQLLLPSGSVTGAATRQGGDSTFGGVGANTGAGVNTGTGANFTGGGGDTDVYSLNLNASWELDLFGRRRAGRRVADADLRTAEFNYEAVRWSLAASIADSLFQARGLAIQLQEAQESLRIQRALYDVAKAKSDYGLTPSSDAAQTLANVQATEAQAEAVQAQLNAARRSLLLLLGRATDPLANLPVPATVGALPPVPAAIPGELLARRPDVREAQWRLASAAGKQTASELALFPTFTLNPGIGVTQIAGVASNSWSLGLGASLPLLDIPRLLAEIRASKAVSEQQVLAYEKIVQTAYSEAEIAFVNLDADSRRVRLLRAAERNAASAYESKRVGYSRGFNDLQTALNAETAWRQARINLAGAEIAAMQRSVQVFKAIGGGWSPDAPGRSALPPGRLN